MIRRQADSHPGVYNTYNSTTTAGIATSSVGAVHEFGFPASYVRIDNIGGQPMWARLGGAVGSTSLASTADFLITTCAGYGTLEFSGLNVSVVQLAATSTAGAFAVIAVG